MQPEPAFAAGGEVALGADLSLDKLVVLSQDVTLDLAGHTLTLANGSALLTKAKLTVKDSAGAGKITANSAKMPTAIVLGGGSLELLGGTIEQDAVTPAVSVSKGGSLTATGGTLIGSTDAENAYAALDVKGGAQVTVSGTAAIKGASAIKVFGDGQVTVEDGAQVGDSDTTWGISAIDQSAVEITDGTVTGNMAVCTNGQDGQAASLTVSGGTITGTALDGEEGVGIYLPSGTLTMTDGTVTGTGAALVQLGGTATVTKGSLTQTGAQADTFTAGDSGQAFAPAAVVVDAAAGYPDAASTKFTAQPAQAGDVVLTADADVVTAMPADGQEEGDIVQLMENTVTSAQPDVDAVEEGFEAIQQEDGTYIVAKGVTVTFKDGDSVVKEEKVVSGKTATAPEMTRSGYTFAGWYDADGNKVTDFAFDKDTVLTAQWDKKRSSGGGGGSSSGVTVSAGKVTLADGITGGSLEVSPESAYTGSLVTVTAKPDAGKEVTAITVTDKDGKAVKTSTLADNKVTFQMPKGGATVDAAFGPASAPVNKDAIVLTVGSMDYTVYGIAKTMDTTPVINADSRTLVPVRFVSEALGAQVDWNANDRTVTITQGDTVIVMTIGSTTYTVNGQEQTMDTTPIINADNRTMVPVRFVSQALGATVDYADGVITITK
jgi:uncharacterized repeat protein (TIGR02543 family)